MTKGHKPRRGSMGVYPRKRARSIVARVRNWVKVDEPKLLGFAGYKVGMLHVIRIEDNPNSPWYGQEIAKAATVVETPPLLVVGLRAYKSTVYGLKSLTEVWIDDLPKDLRRVFTVPKNKVMKNQLKKLEKLKPEISEVRAIVAMQPRLAGIHKKKPEVFEIGIGGSVEDALNYAISKLGKTITIDEIFKEGDYIDVIAVTKGKGYQGPVKRFGVKILPRWHKHRKGHRRIGTVGPQKPSIMFRTPWAGQTGFHQRTEYNKRILKIGNLMPEPQGNEKKEDVEKRIERDNINPPGGWPHYGLVKSMYVLIEGSIPGAIKRLIKLRFPVRPIEAKREEPQLIYVSTREWGV